MEVQVRDLDEARHFYREVVGCPESRTSNQMLDFSLYGHQITCRLDPRLGKLGRVVTNYNTMGGQYSPVSHCNVVLDMEEWNALANRLKRHGAKFIAAPHVRLGAQGARATLIALDPSGNAVECISLRSVAEQRSWSGRGSAFRRWAPRLLFTTFIVCLILLQAKKSADQMAAGNLNLFSRAPHCARMESCLP